jgi:hypothetical protein
MSEAVIASLSASPIKRDDLRLFASTWLAGFVFFLAFLA